MGDQMDIDGPQMEVKQDAEPRQPASAAPLVPQELMKTYYARIFPTEMVYKWLAYGNDTKHPQASDMYFQRREFCFTLPGDIFVRYQSFKDGSDLREALIRRCPAKIDLGPVYNVDPQRRKAYTGVGSGFIPTERELVFDIDLTDYDDVRNCCKEGSICPKDWSYMAAAIKILDEGLREDFGFKHILWVFSGRRGIHCWVCDHRARVMTDRERSAVASYFSAYQGQEKGFAKFSNSNCKHPAMRRALTVCRDFWEERILSEQQIFENSTTAEKILNRIPDPDVIRKFQSTKVQNIQEINEAKWRIISDEIDKRTGIRGGDRKAKAELARAKDEIILAHVYPRLDVEVSKKMNHLLKAPFCVHPKTGKICIPINPNHPEEFSPDDVPTLEQVIEELYGASPGTKATLQGWEQTSLAPYIESFGQSFLTGLKEENQALLSQKARDSKDVLSW